MQMTELLQIPQQHRIQECVSLKASGLGCTSSTSAAASHCRVYSMRGTFTSGVSTFGLSIDEGTKFCTSQHGHALYPGCASTACGLNEQ